MRLYISAALLLVLISHATASNSGVPYLNNPDYVRILYVRVGESKRIQCPVSTDEGTIIFSWFKDNEEIKESWDRYTIRRSDEGRTLKIEQVQQTDSGEFKCDATSGYGKIDEPVTFQLYVLDINEELPYPDTNIRPRERQPEFMHYPPGDSEISLQEGATARLSCLPRNGTTPTITWYYNEAKISTQEGYTLNLTNIRKLAMEGDYKCELSNVAGRRDFTYNIRIQERTKSPAEVLPASPPNTVVNFGTTAFLQCRVKSSIPPKIEWLKLADASLHPTNDQSIKTVKGKVYIKISNKTSGVLTDGFYLNKLVIRRARLEDSGLYICLGTNQLGGFNMSEARFTVKPVPTDIPIDVVSESEFSNWEYIFGSPSATLAVIIAIPVVFILLITIGIIYCLNKRKRMASRRRQPISVVKSDREATVPLNVNGNNGCYTGQYSTYSRPADQYSSGGENGYEPVTYPQKQQHPYYTTYSQSDGSYRSKLHYTPRQYVPPQNDIPDDDSHFSSVSHSRPQYMNSPGGYTRDVHSDPASRMSSHCPPPPPGSYYSGQW